MREDHVCLNDQDERMISKSKIRQLEYESDTWKRQLAFMTDENVHLKERLTETLKDKQQGPTLEEAEIFLNQFIEQDSVITILRNNVAEFDRLLKRERFEDGLLINAVVAKHTHLEEDLLIARKKFEDMKIRFNRHIMSKGQ